MSRANGAIDVIGPAWCFAPDPDEEIVAGRTALAKRTVVHETFHWAMRQAGEASAGYGDEEWVRGNLLSVADTAVEEFRAEASVGGTAGGQRHRMNRLRSFTTSRVR
jgi:hypothetical protein